MDIIIDNNKILEQQKGMIRPTYNLGNETLSISEKEIQDTPNNS